MLTAVQAAVVAAAAAFVAGVAVAVYLMLKAARLMSETSATVIRLRDRGDLLIEAANAAIDAAGEQIARTQTVTASMAGVTATMADLGDHLTALAPPPVDTKASYGPLTWAAALAYGIRWALGSRWAAGRRAPQPARPWPGPDPQPRRPAPPGLPDRGTGRRAALASRANGAAQ